MARPGKVVAVARPEARLYLGKALQFLAEARAGLKDSRFDAALLNAIHAAMSAADSVTVALAARRSADPDHQRTADLLEEVARASEAIAVKARQLRLLLAKKNVVEYESRRATEKEATEAVERAERLVAWAKETVSRAKL